MLTIAALVLFISTATLEPQNTCVSCHEAVGGEIAVAISKIKDDVHGKRGLSCANCHGGDPTEMDMRRSMDPRKGFIGKPAARQVAPFCGKCHSNANVMKQFNPSMRVDQQAEYATSVHGKRVAKGDKNAATCVSCHGNHGIARVSDPNAPVYATHVAKTCGRCHANADYMKPYGIPTDQVEKYRTSVHAEALLKKQDMSAPTCNDCHGNHGAMPPGSASVGNVCGTCHVRQSELFNASPHKAPFEAMGLSQCLACHNNHDISHPTDAFVGVAPGATCVKCHDKGETGYKTAGAIHQHLTQLNNAVVDAESVLDRAARAGMEVSRAKFDLNGTRETLIDARVLIHGFSVEALQRATGPGLKIADATRQAGENALGELLYRRKGLAVSLVLIGLAILSVYLKIRQIEG